MAPRGSQRNAKQGYQIFHNLDPWLHEGANQASPDRADPGEYLDPWLHEGANQVREHLLRTHPYLDPWLHEGANETLRFALINFKI